jgi:hypothetical protein
MAREKNRVLAKRWLRKKKLGDAQEFVDNKKKANDGNYW